MKPTATMTTYLCLALLLFALLPPSHAACSRRSVRADATHCFDEADNKWYPIGSSWRNSACMDCTCDECCDAYSTPRHYPEDCVSVFDRVACKYNVHKRDNPNEPCPIFGSVGK
uniref:beta-microseminoprotein-like n=1 Tax=Doryrhamphus excisus TaxID=161450 RepID=UPI0025AE3AC2|nr:beta-microseminoprotein-like [Doryrhamphus excisus]